MQGRAQKREFCGHFPEFSCTVRSIEGPIPTSIFNNPFGSFMAGPKELRFFAGFRESLTGGGHVVVFAAGQIVAWWPGHPLPYGRGSVSIIDLGPYRLL